MKTETMTAKEFVSELEIKLKKTYPYINFTIKPNYKNKKVTIIWLNGVTNESIHKILDDFEKVIISNHLDVRMRRKFSKKIIELRLNEWFKINPQFKCLKYEIVERPRKGAGLKFNINPYKSEKDFNLYQKLKQSSELFIESLDYIDIPENEDEYQCNINHELAHCKTPQRETVPFEMSLGQGVTIRIV